MPFVYANAGALVGKPKVGSKECVALVQHYTSVGLTRTWVAGAKVLGNPRIKIGTAIATFRNGRYLSHKSNNHAAFFLRHENGGIVVIDQWNDDPARPDAKRDISVRTIRPRGRAFADGTWPHESDNAEAFFVIETGASASTTTTKVPRVLK